MFNSNSKTMFAFGLIVMAMHLQSIHTAYTAEKETEIRSETVLHSSYDPVSRPKSQTHVKTGLNILAIDELNLKDQKLTMAGWLTFEWEDERLTWNKSAKDDIEYIFTKPDYIWKPEVIIDNSMLMATYIFVASRLFVYLLFFHHKHRLTDLEIVSSKNLNLRLKYDGTVDWEPLKLFQVHCEVDITYYPYDEQRCAVDIVSWAYTYDEVVLDHLFESVNLEDFVRHGEWRIYDTDIEDKNLTEHIPGEHVRIYPQLVFWMSLQRRTEFYNLNVMMPIILTSLMVVMVFIVPLDSGEKVSYVLTLFLSLAVLLTIIADSLPPTSITISVLGLYLGIVLILAALAILLTVLIMILFHKKGIPAPDCIMVRMTSCAAKVTRMYLPGSKSDSSNGDNKVEPISPLNDNHLDVVDLTSPNDVKMIPKSNGQINQHVEHAPPDENLTWKDIATIMDRFCFICFSLLTVVMNISFVVTLTYGGQS